MRAVDIASMFDGDDEDFDLFVVDAVDDAERASPCRVQTFEVRPEGFSYPVRVLNEVAADEFDARGSNWLG